MIKTLSKLVIEGKFLNLIKNIYQKKPQKTKKQNPQLTSYLMMWQTIYFSPKFGSKAKMPLLTTPIYCTVSHSYCNKTRKRNKRYTNWEGRNKTVFIHRWHDWLWGNPKESTAQKHQVKLINNYSKIAGYKANPPKYIICMCMYVCVCVCVCVCVYMAFLCIKNEQIEFEIKNNTTYISTKKWNRYKSNKIYTGSM